MIDLTEKIVVAAEQGALEQVQEALQQGASPDAMGPNSGALHCAAAGGHQAIVDLLLDAGANPNIADQQSLYPLHLAASSCSALICQHLLKAGAAVDATTSKGGTALHVAAATGCPDVIKILLDAGANLEALDSYEATPLLAAATEGEPQAVQLLLAAGANIAVVDKNKETALLKATRRLLQTRVNHWTGVQELEGKKTTYEIVKGAFRIKTEPTQPLGELLSLEDQYLYVMQAWGPRQHLGYIKAVATINDLLQAGVDVQTTNVVGHTAMWMACSAGEAKVIRALHQQGATFDAVENNGEFKGITCLHKAAASGRLDGLEAFVDFNPDAEINVPDHYGWTPLHYFADMGGPT